jgi:myo-inositol-1(or 4)-monophosphatase
VSLPFRAEALGAIAEQAAAVTQAALAAPLDVAEKADRSPVTAVDRAVDHFLRRELTALLPESGWLSEETFDDRTRLARELVWIVDPIDGTKQLIRGLPEVAISIGLVRRGLVVAAAVINPMTGERGAWVEGASPVFERLKAMADPESLETAEAIVSRTETEAGDLRGLPAVVGSTRPVGSVAYKLLRVAARADALTYSVRPKSEWDICGGVGLLTAAGRVYLRLDGAPLLFNRSDTHITSGAVAGPASLAAPLRLRLNALLG